MYKKYDFNQFICNVYSSFLTYISYLDMMYVTEGHVLKW